MTAPHVESSHPPLTSDRIGPDDPRYADLLARGNRRFMGRPDYVRVVSNAAQVVEAVQDAVREGRRVVARSGGQCLEPFVVNPEVRAIIDLSLLADVVYDPAMRAFTIGPGATLGEAYRKLYLGWGVTIPAGLYPIVGIGGHIPGGGHGCLYRQHGMAADHLYAIEIVVVDAAGRASLVLATREPDDPQRELWWAHTGGGGGNFGIVTRYWFRSPDAQGANPAALLPRAPGAVLRCTLKWDWSQLDAETFARLVCNYGEWCERHSSPDSPYNTLWSVFQLNHRALGTIDLRVLVLGGDTPEQQLDEYLAAICAGVDPPHTRSQKQASWLAYSLDPFPETNPPPGAPPPLFKLKDAWLRRRLSDRQIEVAYRFLTHGDGEVAGNLGLETTGGRANLLAPDATASAHRDAILRAGWTTGWAEPRDESRSLTWLRDFYRDIFADSGGVPVPNEASDGAFINHPDIDLADPAWNTSGVPWHTLYYKENYPRLQRAKARWDPRDIFHHQLAIRADFNRRETATTPP